MPPTTTSSVSVRPVVANKRPQLAIRIRAAEAGAPPGYVTAQLRAMWATALMPKAVTAGSATSELSSAQTDRRFWLMRQR